MNKMEQEHELEADLRIVENWFGSLDEKRWLNPSKASQLLKEEVRVLFYEDEHNG